MVRRAAVLTNDVDRLRRDVVVLILARFFLEGVDEHFQVLLGDFAKKRVRVGVIEIDHHCHLREGHRTSGPYQTTLPVAFPITRGLQSAEEGAA
jgi:hypothetical protein